MYTLTAAKTVMAKFPSWSAKAIRVFGTQEWERREPVRYSPVSAGVSGLSETIQNARLRNRPQVARIF